MSVFLLSNLVTMRWSGISCTILHKFAGRSTCICFCISALLLVLWMPYARSVINKHKLSCVTLRCGLVVQTEDQKELIFRKTFADNFTWQHSKTRSNRRVWRRVNSRAAVNVFHRAGVPTYKSAVMYEYSALPLSPSFFRLGQTRNINRISGDNFAFSS